MALGGLGKLVDLDVQGEMLNLKPTVNSMGAQLSTLASEVTHVSLEVGTAGILGRQAFVPEVQGMWKVHSSHKFFLTKCILQVNGTATTLTNDGPKQQQGTGRHPEQQGRAPGGSRGCTIAPSVRFFDREDGRCW